MFKYSRLLLLIILTASSSAFSEKPTYNILFLGQSGAGKSSLINFLYNHLKNIDYESPWEIVIPLMHRNTEYLVNVDEYKKYNVQLKPKGGSQTSDVNRYWVETKSEKFVFWDTPGFGDTAGFLKDQENISKISEAVSDVQFHAILITIGNTMSIDRLDVNDKFMQTINHIRGMLPKAMKSNLIGIYNREGTQDLDEQETLGTDFSTILGFSAKDKELKIITIDGKGFFGKMGLRTSKIGKFLNKSKWEADKMALNDLIDSVKSRAPVSGNDVLKIHQYIHGLEGWALYLEDTVSSLLSEEKKLEVLNNDLTHLKHQRDSNAGYQKSREVKWQTKEQSGCGGVPGEYVDQYVRLGRCDVIVDHSRIDQYIDEDQQKEYDSAVRDIESKNKDIKNCENRLNSLRDLKAHIINEMVKLQEMWDNLAITTDLTPMIRIIDQKMREVNSNISLSKDQKNHELDTYRQMRDVYHQLQKRTPDL
jgi:GTP-binding protein EngB required for normal cell division